MARQPAFTFVPFGNTPILNKGQLVILGIGRVEQRLALASDSSIEQRSEIGLSLTVDHRFIDGDPAARILGSICDQLAIIGNGG
ncbi:2-oxo acid dehydrogenase subunit E2 [Sphingorhabdus buctiana]|uniref:2-oxo acid dehydrogenase subunit E2 n=1 Tax=Sphingorhabdus buctiana TaxID=1508805 RepID=A0ABW4MFB1_9SPHN